MICFVGDSHAPRTLAAAAVSKGLTVTDDPAEATLVFVSQDTPTNDRGERDVTPIRELVLETYARTTAPVVLTSQVPPGFTRSIGIENLIHMAETLRIKDAAERAIAPEQFILGVAEPETFILPVALERYMSAHEQARHHVLVMPYEDAEFAKIAINMMLAAQVDAANMLSAAAAKCGAHWARVCWALENDKRIGPHAYLKPGRWQDSSHLLRDYVTLRELLAR